MHSRKICVLLYRNSRLEVFCKKCALKIPQNSQKNTCFGVYSLKKRLQSRCFPVSFVKLLRAPFYRTRPVAVSHYRKLTFNLIDVFMCSTLTKLKLKLDYHHPKNIFYFLPWKHFKNDEKYFLFHFKSSFPSHDI